MILDIFSDFFTGLFIFGLFGLVGAVVVAYLVSRWFAHLPPMTQALITAALIVVGFVLILTAVGAGIGAITILTAVLIRIFVAIHPKRGV